MRRTCPSCDDRVTSYAFLRVQTGGATQCGDCLDARLNEETAPLYREDVMTPPDHEDAVTRLERDVGLRLWDMQGNDE